MEFDAFIFKVIAILELRNPFDIVLSGRGDAKFAAWAQPKMTRKNKIRRHKIYIYAANTEQSGRTLRELTAHELVHAKVWELKICEPFHGPVFQFYARQIERKFPSLRVYLPDTDTP